ncbi:MAG: hypothetical protein K9J27_10595 [Bacteroidales bacterium]|nr:hypothetical protein [Bacteroidales bacterium]MCF8334206.1 hypothetical protein [Bacteroidales bacterium]
MIKLPIRTYFFIVLLAGFAGCADKKGFNPSPEVKIIQPAESINITVPDSVLVKARLFDEDTLREVSLNLLDRDKQPVSGSVIFRPDSTDYTLHYDYPINDTLVETGTYYLQVSAYDGGRQFARNVKAHIQGVEKRVQGFIVIRGENEYLTLERYNADFKRIKKQSFLTDYHTSRFHSPRKLLFLAGAAQTPLKVIHMEDIVTQWEKSFSADRDYHFMDNMILSGNKLLTSYYSKQESAVYNFSGNRMKDIQLENSYFPGKMALSGEYIFLERISYGFTERKLGVYYRETAAHAESYQIAANDVFAMKAFNNDSLFMAARAGESHKLMLFNNETKVFSSLKTFQSKPMQLILRDKNSFLISTAKHIYNYHIKNDYLQMIHSGQKKIIRYDKVNDRVYILYESRVEVIDATLGLTANSFPLQEEITDFHLFYNR